MMKTYLVGGAVRDELLGRPVTDRDWVVVGATPNLLIEKGYLPVGSDFPVFLHPDTKEEYALARTERKISKGYKGFTIFALPTVTLEQDLARRDLTINALAKDDEGNIIDYFNGQKDLDERVLRHVTPAFAEDPVRILRVARFAARYHDLDFQVADETMILMQKMVKAGEVDALVPERVWQEISKALMEIKPSICFTVIKQSQALEKVIPAFHRLTEQQWNTLLTNVDRCAANNATLEQRFAALALPAQGESNKKAWLQEVNGRLKLPKSVADFASLALNNIHHFDHCSLQVPSDILAFLKSCDAFRRPERFRDFLALMKFTNPHEDTQKKTELLTQALHITDTVHIDAESRERLKGVEIGAYMDTQRLAKIQSLLESH